MEIKTKVEMILYGVVIVFLISIWGMTYNFENPYSIDESPTICEGNILINGSKITTSKSTCDVKIQNTNITIINQKEDVHFN